VARVAACWVSADHVAEESGCPTGQEVGREPAGGPTGVGPRCRHWGRGPATGVVASVSCQGHATRVDVRARCSGRRRRSRPSRGGRPSSTLRRGSAGNSGRRTGCRHLRRGSARAVGRNGDFLCRARRRKVRVAARPAARDRPSDGSCCRHTGPRGGRGVWRTRGLQYRPWRAAAGSGPEFGVRRARVTSCVTG